MFESAERNRLAASYDRLHDELAAEKSKVVEMTDSLSRQVAEKNSIVAECDRLQLEVVRM